MGFNPEQFKSIFKQIYADDQQSLSYQTERYSTLQRKYTETFGDEAVEWFSTPGRTELSGNHTDHNHGRVLAASIDLDSVALAAANDKNKVVTHSDGFDQPFIVDLGDLKMRAAEQGTTTALIRGIAAGLVDSGYAIGGFNARITSDVLQGSGLSSSASIEVLIGTIFNRLYNQNRIEPVEIAKIGQYAENIYFGKPCGLMDQIACATGGVVAIDFKNPLEPQVEKVSIDFKSLNYALLVVDTGGSHADLTPDYAAIPAEMKQVAAALGKEYCREIKSEEFLSKVAELRGKISDRAILRTLHFLQENKRVSAQVSALLNGDFKRFLKLVRESGESSFKWLQNIFSPANIDEQGVTLALALSEKYINEHSAGACRVHGGGFAGTILVFLAHELVDGYKKMIEPIFGKDSIVQLKIRDIGTINLNRLL